MKQMRADLNNFTKTPKIQAGKTVQQAVTNPGNQVAMLGTYYTLDLNLLKPTGYVIQQQFKLLKPTGHVMHQQLQLLKPTG